MTDHSEGRPVADTIQNCATRAIAVQSEFSEKLIEANRHWLEQIQVESTEAWELFRKFNSTASAAEKITALQDWAKGATSRVAQDATYAIETARALSTIELNFLKPRADDPLQKAA